MKFRVVTSTTICRISEGAAKALDYIKNYPGITYEEVGSNG